MDDDKQVKDLTTQTTIRRFLSKPVLPDEKDKETFDLEKEFAKSAKNKSPLIPLVVAAFLLVLAAGAWVASYFTEEASQKSSVSIGSFEDLKLKEIFDTARKNKKDLENIQAQIEELTQASAAKVSALTQAGNSKADIASVNDSSGSQAKAILAQTASQVAAEKASLAKALAPLKAQAEEVQKRIDSYDDRIGQMNKKNQQVLDTQQRLFDIEKKKLIDQYEARIEAQTAEAVSVLARVKQERDALVAAMKAKHADDIRKLILKYNPVISDAVFQPWIARDGATPPAAPLLPFPSRIESRGLVPADLQADFQARIDRTKQLLARLRAIPYENSVPPLLNTLDKAISDALVGYNGYLAPLAAHMESLDAEIANRDATIAQKEEDIRQLEATIADLNARLATAAAEKQALAEKTAADQEVARLWLARWTGAVDDFVATLKEDGVLVDVRNSQDWMVVLKGDRAKALDAALEAALLNPPPAQPTGKTVAPINLATVRDGLNNNELGTVTVDPAANGVWRATLVKQNDPKRPFKAFDRLVLSLPAAKR